jgi:site-specific DNA-methyltransferase (adenine-specific)
MTPYYEQDGITLYCGDCRDILPTFPDKSFDLVLTDPPYGHNNNNGDMASRWEAIFEGRKEEYDEAKEFRPIANDGVEANELVKWSFSEWFRLLNKPGSCCCCCCGGGGPDPQFARWSLWLDDAFEGGFKQMVIWDKGPMGMGHHYRRSYETVLVAQKGAPAKWYDTTKRVENVIRPGMYGIGKIIPSKSQHPTEKPVELMSLFIRLHTQPGESILEPFAGHGTTLVAAKQLGRKAVGIEISEKYCEIAVKRLAQIELF